MKKNDIIELEIVDIGNNGEGIAKHENFVIFIPFALKGEKIEAHILKINKNFAFGKINKVITPSHVRIKAPCPYFAKCGGCNIQHINYNEQLRIKTEIVKNALIKYAKIDTNVLSCVPSEKIFGYRNKMQYPCTINGIGMYAQNSHRLIAIESCKLSMKNSDTAYQIFKSFCKKTNQTFYYELNHKGLIRHFLIREIDNQLSICIVINGNEIKNIEILIEMLQNEFKNTFSLFININKFKNNTILSNDTICLFGNETLKAEDFGIKYFISPNSFLQINREIQNKIYSKVLDFIEKDSFVINAYSGAGLLTAITAKKAKKVFGIEIIEHATKNADMLMKINNIKNVSNITNDCAIELPKLITSLKQDENIILILDPPRKGCDSKILEAINISLPQKIAYISCNPATLARDLEKIKSNYSIEFVQPFDMFPQTRHIETLVLLKRKN